MAKDQAIQFIARVNDDQILQDKLQTVTTEGIDGLLRIAKEAGFDFTAEEIQMVATERRGLGTEQISDEALESMSGGGLPGNGLPGNGLPQVGIGGNGMPTYIFPDTSGNPILTDLSPK